MILCLDIGNTHIFGGVFSGDQLKFSFRNASKTGASSDEHGLFFRGVLRENGIDPEQITNVAICSVVPEMVYTISAACAKYFDKEPFVLRAGAKTGLKVLYRDPHEVGSDRIANAIAATRSYPGRNLLIVDLGTATTVCAVSSDNSYLGGVIMPGLKMSMQALDRGTSNDPPLVVATGGFARLFEKEGLFDEIIPDLVLKGLLMALLLNLED